MGGKENKKKKGQVKRKNVKLLKTRNLTKWLEQVIK
jgi:hypothetical protein